jgi:hypothetical protein
LLVVAVVEETVLVVLELVVLEQMLLVKHLAVVVLLRLLWKLELVQAIQ